MANSERGEVAMTVDGQRYRLQLSWNAVAVLKKQTGLGLKGVTDAFAAMGDDPDPGLVTAVLWAAMQDHHPDLTLEHVATFFPAGGLEETIEKLEELFSAAFPRSMAKAGAAQNPPQAATTK